MVQIAPRSQESVPGCAGQSCSDVGGIDVKRGVLAIIAAVVVAAIGAFPVSASIHPTANAKNVKTAAALTTANWTSYHYDNTGAGYDPNQPAFSTLTAAWTQTSII